MCIHAPEGKLFFGGPGTNLRNVEVVYFKSKLKVVYVKWSIIEVVYTNFPLKLVRLLRIYTHSWTIIVLWWFCINLHNREVVYIKRKLVLNICYMAHLDLNTRNKTFNEIFLLSPHI